MVLVQQQSTSNKQVYHIIVPCTAVSSSFPVDTCLAHHTSCSCAHTVQHTAHTLSKTLSTHCPTHCPHTVQHTVQHTVHTLSNTLPTHCPHTVQHTAQHTVQHTVQHTQAPLIAGRVPALPSGALHCGSAPACHPRLLLTSMHVNWQSMLRCARYPCLSAFPGPEPLCR